MFQRRSGKLRIDTSAVSAPGKSLGTTLKKTVFTWVNMIFEGRANIAKAYSSEMGKRFYFSEEVSRDVDIEDPAA